MKRVLGLDLGTSSVGWAVVDQAENENEKSQIIKMGVRIVPIDSQEKDDFEKGKSITTTADRNLKHGMRINLQRYKQRREHLIKLLKREGFITDKTLLYEDGNKSTFETYRYRAMAATQEVQSVVIECLSTHRHTIDTKPSQQLGKRRGDIIRITLQRDLLSSAQSTEQLGELLWRELRGCSSTYIYSAHAFIYIRGT